MLSSRCLVLATTRPNEPPVSSASSNHHLHGKAALHFKVALMYRHLLQLESTTRILLQPFDFRQTKALMQVCLCAWRAVELIVGCCPELKTSILKPSPRLWTLSSARFQSASHKTRACRSGLEQGRAHVGVIFGQTVEKRSTCFHHDFTAQTCTNVLNRNGTESVQKAREVQRGRLMSAARDKHS